MASSDGAASVGGAVVWGFHVHQEVDDAEFDQALAVQQRGHAYLTSHGVSITAADAIAPGYGPHLNWMWELRVEQESRDTVLDKLGLAISWLAVNRYGLSGYIHPCMHDEHLPVMQALRQEGETNQVHAIWFTRRVAQHQEFFFNPPLADDGVSIADTRTQRVMTAGDKRDRAAKGTQQLGPARPAQDPASVITGGFHIHMDYLPEQESEAMAVYQQFLAYLRAAQLPWTSTTTYAAGTNGPHVQAGWEVKYERENDPAVLRIIGHAMAWLMCNRRGLSVFAHPVTWQDGDHREELRAHEQYSFFIGQLPELDLTFFSSKIKD